ncbi:MAG: dihydroneopterin aldolase family protein [Candidatus Helarchaeota archaeon]
METKVKKYFSKNVTDRDRAIFEGAITLGATYHQFIGTPLRNDPKIISSLEKSIELTMSCQPFIEKVEVKITPPEIGSNEHHYNYSALNRKNFTLRVISKYGKVKVYFKMKYIPELDFPLMFIEKIED